MERSEPQSATGNRHVMVVGMHRSGTSGMAHTLAELGMAPPDPDDLVPAGPGNEQGHWESQSLLEADNQLLRLLGGTWHAPPRTFPGWEQADGPIPEAFRSEAAQLARNNFARTPMVLKDPRLCITLPFWRSLFESEPCAVFVLRDPLEVALSLRARHSDLPLTLGLAIWDRYVRQAMTSMAGMPVFAIEYPSIVEEPGRRIGELVAFLADCGIQVSNENVASASGILEPGLRYQRADGGEDSTLADQERNVLQVLRSSLGPHESWSPPELPEERSWVEDVIELTRAGQAVLAALHFAQDEFKKVERSRLIRATQVWWRMTGRGPVTPLLTPPSDATIGVGVITNGHEIDGVTTQSW
jgi:hypothetical protein